MPLEIYLVNILIAAALGAGTNELAIVAILRYILPRKKGEIARRIRDLVATDLLSPEKLRQKIDEPQSGLLLQRCIDQALAEFLARDLPSPRELLGERGDRLDALSARLREALLDEFTRRANDPAFTDEVVRPFLEERWRTLKGRTPDSLLGGRADGLPERLEEWLASLERSATLRETVRAALDGWLEGKLARSESPADFLSPGLIAAAGDLAASQAPFIMRSLTDALRDDALQEAMTGAVMNAIRGQLESQGVLGGIKGAFIGAMRIHRDVEGVCARLPDTLYHNLHRPENRAAFVSRLREAAGTLLGRRLDAGRNTPALRARAVELLLDRVWREKNFRRLAAGAAGVARRILAESVEDTLRDIGCADECARAALDEAARRVCRAARSDAARELLGARFDEFAADWSARPVGRLERFVSPETRAEIARAAADEALALLRRRLAEIVEESGIWDIVTTSIEGYDDREIGDLVRQLARSELRWITVLGGVIGAAVGLAQTAVQGLA